MDKTYLEKLIAETVRPIAGALELLRKEFMETMQIPESPWQILNKPYDQLSEQELAALMDIYHTEGEQTPCPFCQWVSRIELSKMRKEKDGELEELGGQTNA